MKTANDGDIHGRKRMPMNVLYSWASQLVGIASGFVVPRLIGDSLGQETLGLWDFSWSMVAYLGLVQGGVVSSINRYVAAHNSKGDVEGLNQAVSSVAFVLRGMAGIVLLLTIVLALIAPKMLASGSKGLHGHGNVTYLVLLLGTGVAVQMASSVYSGILTGFHRWDIHNSVYAISNVCLFIGMFTALKMGFGLLALAIVHLACETGGRLARLIIAKRIFPELNISWQKFNKKVAVGMLCFGGKNFTSYVSQLLLNQTVNILIATQFGAAALAIYARPMSLVRNMTGVVQKFSMVLTPTVSSLYAAGKGEELRKLFVQTLKFNLWYTIPLLIVGFAFAEEIMTAWMGPKFADGTLLRIIIIGFGGTIIHLPILQILSGMDKHGKLAWMNLTTAIIASCAAVGWMMFNKTGGLHGLAVCVGVPVFFTNAFRIPMVACKEIGIGYGEFCRKVYGPVFLSSLPFALMAGVAYYYHDKLTFATGAAIIVLSMICFLIVSWIAVAPETAKNKITKITNQQWKWFLRLGKAVND